MGLRILRTSLHTVELRTRMPFKFGIATLTALPHLFVRAEIEIDGRLQIGVAAENLPPKWFTKNPSTRLADDVQDMLEVIRAACGFAQQVGHSSNPFSFWKSVYDAQRHWARSTRHPPLLWSFGITLVERAAIDAFCRATSQTFATALQTNALGIELGELHPELVGAKPSDFLPPAPLRSLIVRHTVGLSDPLTDAEIAPDQRIDDGLPQSLEACVAAYGLTHFKIKLGGDVDRDASRLRDIARLLRGRDVRFTLDGNESYPDVESLRSLWDRVAADPFIDRMIVLEQPLHRDVALSDETALAFAAWPGLPPMIIDESDDQLDSSRRALATGYVGTSYKGCKGVFKGIGNACLMARRGGVLTAEDLSTVAPVSLLQDLAVVAALGIRHVERNGHHYFRGLSGFGPATQRHVLAAHGDLYRDCGYPTLRIDDGAIDTTSVAGAPFGVGFDFDPAQMD